MDFFNQIQKPVIVPENCTYKKGDRIVVVHLENSRYNAYKGYIGEIRDYRKDNDHAMVSLDACHYQKQILLPLKHFKPLT